MEDSALPPEAPLEGVTLRGRYRVESKLGQGGMASVYMATDEELGRQVVVKVPLMRLMDMEGFKERFELEIQGMTDIEHPHVVSILARGEHEDTPYFVLQYLKGGSLEDQLYESAENRLEAKAITKWLPFVADALDFIGGNGIVHRDVKPGNILFDASGNVALSDFGVAKALGGQDDELTAAGSTVGSPEYMAPEQITNEVGPATDQYALAVTVYECLSGELPFQGENMLEVLLAKRARAPEPLSERCGIPKEISDVVNKALAPDPEARYGSCTAFSAAFEQAVWALDPTPAPGMRTPRSAAGFATPAPESPLSRTMGGSPDFTGQLLLGHYKVGGKLGSGGMGTVYLAVDTDLGKSVVIKVPHFRLLAEKGFIARFEREVKQLLKLEHPSVVRVLARGDQQGIPFYVLQYMKEGSLRDRMKRAENGRMSAEDILAWFESTSRALDFLHSRHLIHRDVKPGNILFDEHEHAYLSDFGIAKAKDDENDQHLTTTSTGVGSPRYMAPEQTGEKFDGKADQYALATTVFETLAGRVPFEDGTAMEIMLKKMQERPPSVADLVDGIPAHAAAAITKALAPKAADRFPTCRAFFLAFKRGLRGEASVSLLDRPTVAAPVAAPVAPPTHAPLELAPDAATGAPKKKAAARRRAPTQAGHAPARERDAPPPREAVSREAVSREAVPLGAPAVRAPASKQATAAARRAGLWQPTFILGFVGVWLLARLAPFARFALPHDLLSDVAPDVLVVLWACVPTAIILAVGHGWLLQTRGVTPAWAWVLATLIGAAVGAIALLMYPRVMDTGLRIHPMGVVTAAVMAAALGVCQWLALIERQLRTCHLWLLLSIVGAVVAGALLEFIGGGGGEKDFLLVVGAALLMAFAQLYALRRMAPEAARRGGAA